MINSEFRTVEYLRKLAHFPLALLIDEAGDTWTWAEGRSVAIAVRGQLPGLSERSAMWRDPAGWRSAMRACFSAPRRRASRVCASAALLSWAGTPWVSPEDPCPHCHGTGLRTGTASGKARPGALRRNVRVDRNLLAGLLLPFEPGALVVDVNSRTTARDPIRIRSVDGETRALLARMVGGTEGLDVFRGEELDSDTSLSLSLPTAPEAPARVIGRRERCPHCGGAMAGGVCEKCHKVL